MAVGRTSDQRGIDVAMADPRPRPTRRFKELSMKTPHSLLAIAAATTIAALTFAASPSFAQGAAAAAPAGGPAAAPGFVQRDINQDQRIEQGLKSGQLNTREAARLEGEQAHVDKLEAKALSDGKISAQERARINAAQNRTSADIAREKHDAQKGNPNSASSQRMQADVQRNINQQQRIQQGMASGQLTHHEAAKLEAGQAHVARTEARAGKDGHVSAGEQARVQTAENVQSRRIHREKHDGQMK
jgi:hypothetical protein